MENRSAAGACHDSPAWSEAERWVGRARMTGVPRGRHWADVAGGKFQNQFRVDEAVSSFEFQKQFWVDGAVSSFKTSFEQRVRSLENRSAAGACHDSPAWSEAERWVGRARMTGVPRGRHQVGQTLRGASFKTSFGLMKQFQVSKPFRPLSCGWFDGGPSVTYWDGRFDVEGKVPPRVYAALIRLGCELQFGAFGVLWRIPIETCWYGRRAWSW